MPNQPTNPLVYKVTVNSRFVQMLLDALPGTTMALLSRQMNDFAARAARDAKPVPAGFVGFGEIESTDVDGYHIVFNNDLKERRLDIMGVVTRGCRCPVDARGQQGECRCSTSDIDELLKFIDTLAYIAASSGTSVTLPAHVWTRYAESRAPGQEDPTSVRMDCEPFGQVVIECMRGDQHIDTCSLLSLYRSGDLKRRRSLAD
ncbi:hypothetical protein [Corallococcus exiguus]|uniref:Uncharacterized protein n=1 Tax=Corallococcus exiguus TaxID=83462 RepID=A0A7X4Y7R0_9BACT|nr:hypothetical protein [Corallococcus exiguus]NBC40460.1 hypothetical protein [Corallococcus exiguus]TNV64057.1 hypothetical protein FH620_13540 [Corallococcus exiguus]